VQAGDVTFCPNTTLGVDPSKIRRLNVDTSIRGPRLIKLYDVKNKITPWSVSVDTEGQPSLLYDGKVKMTVNVKELEKSFGKMRTFKRTYFIGVADNQTPFYLEFVLKGDGILEKFLFTTEGASTEWSIIRKER